MPSRSELSLDDSDIYAEEQRELRDQAQGLLQPGWPWTWRRGRVGRSASDGGCSKSTGRMLRLALVCLVCPALLLGWPLYMRYFVLRDLALPLAPSDVRMLDLHVSTAWCQAQEVRANGTFNAWMLGGRPRRGSRRRVSLVRDIRLGDDAKEYWGFYLLEGSVVTVSPCARWPGVSLVVIRGYNHLLECAYIGDDSSEEVEEVRRNALRRQLEESRRLRPLTPPDGAPPDAAPPDAVPPTPTTARVPIPKDPKQGFARSNLPHRMHVVKEEAVELHEKTRPPPRLFNKQDWDEDVDMAEAESSVEAGAEVARGLLDQLRGLGSAGRHALERLRTARLRRELTEEVVEEATDDNTAAERVDTPEAPAPGQDVRGWVNETTSRDESHSELWSSFSSSEEALLACSGLVLNLPLTPHRHCQRRWPPDELGHAAAANVITYRVPADGHYFFVLGSENEIQTNFVRVRFDLDKVVYDIENPLAECNATNATSACSMPLRFLSDDTLVMEIPVDPNQGDNGDHGDHGDQILAMSTCKPRTALYVAFVLALPAIILTCAF